MWICSLGRICKEGSGYWVQGSGLLTRWELTKWMKRFCFCALIMVLVNGCSNPEHTVIRCLDDYYANRSRFVDRKIMVVFTAHASSTRILEDLFLSDSSIGKQLDKSKIDILLIPADDGDLSIQKLVREFALETYPSFVLCDGYLLKCSDIAYLKSTNLEILRKRIIELIETGCTVPG